MTRVAAIEGWFTDNESAPELLGTRGTESGSYFFPPTLAVSANPNAPFETREPVALSRTGTLWSYTTNHYAPPEPAVQTAPYTVCAVELNLEKIVILGPLATGASLADSFAVARNRVAEWEGNALHSEPQTYVGRNMAAIWNARPASTVAPAEASTKR